MPVVKNRLRELFQQNSGGGRCPGERDCERFQTSAGDDDNKKAENACTTCEFLSTKIKTASGSADSWATGVCRQIERLRSEQRGGFSVDENTINNLEYEGLIIWHDLESQYERIRQAEQTELLKAFLGVKAR